MNPAAIHPQGVDEGEASSAGADGACMLSEVAGADGACVLSEVADGGCVLSEVAGAQGACVRLEALITALRATPQATATLAALAVQRGWSDAIRTRKLEVAIKPAPESVASALALATGEQVGFRQVELVCGQRVLSRADNWFVASRLADAVNAQLASSDEPFGLVIGDLEPRRKVLALERLWAPDAGPVPEELFRLSAVVSGKTAVGRAPLALVTETYLADAIL